MRWAVFKDVAVGLLTMSSLLYWMYNESRFLQRVDNVLRMVSRVHLRSASARRVLHMGFTVAMKESCVPGLFVRSDNIGWSHKCSLLE